MIHFFNINNVDSTYLVLNVKLLELGSEAAIPSVTSTCNIFPRSCMLVMIWRYLRPFGADIQVSNELYSTLNVVLTNVTIATDDSSEFAHM